MHTADLAIIAVYFALMVAVGAWVTKQAARNPESYFLAGKSLPWWVIGVAHGSSGIDIGGTMWFVTMLCIYGAKGLFLLWIWPLFNVLFRMVYLGTFHRAATVRERRGLARCLPIVLVQQLSPALPSLTVVDPRRIRRSAAGRTAQPRQPAAADRRPRSRRLLEPLLGLPHRPEMGFQAKACTPSGPKACGPCSARPLVSPFLERT